MDAKSLFLLETLLMTAEELYQHVNNKASVALSPIEALHAALLEKEEHQLLTLMKMPTSATQH